MGAGIWIFSLDQAALNELNRPGVRYAWLITTPAAARVFGLVVIALFGICAAVFIKQLFDKKPAMIFNDAGIIDNSSAAAAGFVPWAEIIGVSRYAVAGQQMLVIKVRNPDKYIEVGRAATRSLKRRNDKVWGSYIHLSD